MQHEKTRAQSKPAPDVVQISQRPVYCPVRCPACGKLELVSDRFDLEEHMERKFAKCLNSSDPACKKAANGPSVAVLRDRLQAKSST